MLAFAHSVFTLSAPTQRTRPSRSPPGRKHSRMGVNSHGIMRIPQYVSDIAKAPSCPTRARRLCQTRGGGLRSMAVIASASRRRCQATAAAAAAKKHGIAFVTACEHGSYRPTRSLRRDDCGSGVFRLAGAGTSRSAEGNWVAPFGGKEGRLRQTLWPTRFRWPAKIHRGRHGDQHDG